MAEGACTIGDRIREFADRQPDAPAILESDKATLTYAALARRLDDVGRWLSGRGIGRGDRLALILPNGAEMAVACLGVTDCATAVPLNPDYTASEFASYLEPLGLRAAIIQEGRGDAAREAAKRLGIRVVDLIPAADGTAGAFFLDGPGRASGLRHARSAYEDIAIVLQTAGTTAGPKIVPLSHVNQLDRACKKAAWVELCAADRLLHFMPLFHGQGINMGLVTPLITGGSVIFSPGLDADLFYALLEGSRPTWYTAGPTHHRAILARAADYRETIARSSLRFIRSGSGHLAPSVIAELERTFGVPVVETYNLSEAGTLAGAPIRQGDRRPGSVGRIIAGQVAVMDREGLLLGPGETGEIVTRGPSVFPGYDGNHEANAEAFVDGWFRTGDLGSVDADGFLTLKGRIKEMINRGGEKIAPIEVDRALMSHPAVGEAIAFAMPHRTMNEDVEAAVVLKDGRRCAEDELRRHARRQLAAFKVPRRIHFVDAIPKGASGKPLRKEMAARLRCAAPAGGDGCDDASRGRPPETPLQSALAEIWAEQLDRPSVGIDDDFFALGGDSLQAISLFLRIEEKLGRSLPRAALFEAGTVAEMARRIESDQPAGCIVAIQPDGELPPFFCVHDGFGEVLNFRHLARELGRDQPFYGIQALGLDGREPLILEVEDMARRYLDDVRRVQPRGPYYLGGYSFGGKVAFEMAHLLKAAGEEIGLLALIDSYARGVARRAPVGLWLRRHMAGLAGLPAADWPRYLGQRLDNAACLLGAEARQRRLTGVLRGDRSGRTVSRRDIHDVCVRAARRYVPRPIEARVTLFHAELYAWAHPDVHHGWHRFVEGGVDMRRVAGRHDTLLDEPNAAVLARELRAAMCAARAALPRQDGG